MIRRKIKSSSGHSFCGRTSLLILMALLYCAAAAAQDLPRPPIMGWSSWNHFRVNIDQEMIKQQAVIMSSNGMKEAGYTYINTDDGYFGGRDREGRLLINKDKFPDGMKSLANFIHQQGLKAGIYSDAGINTCASMWDADTLGVGCGLYGHDSEDLKTMLVDWDFDFIKVDWCGGEKLGLNEEERYTQLANLAYELKPQVVFNVCRWQFPGEWVLNVADSWRISGDIRSEYQSIVHIIDQNADLWPYCSPGHYNDMDMLQVGRGMSYAEDKTHFTMWCMMVSPLLAGNDLRTLSPQTLSILTNQDVIALNQDPLFYQARRIEDQGDLEIWAKPLRSTTSGIVAITLLNRSNQEAEISFSLESIGLDPAQGYTMKDLWSKEVYDKSQLPTRTFTVPSHDVITLQIQGTHHAPSVAQHKR